MELQENVEKAKGLQIKIGWSNHRLHHGEPCEKIKIKLINYNPTFNWIKLTFRGVAFGHHIKFGPKSSHMEALAKM
jgi:hypothetical protein